jgi:hypothetical protein
MDRASVEEAAYITLQSYQIDIFISQSHYSEHLGAFDIFYALIFCCGIHHPCRIGHFIMALNIFELAIAIGLQKFNRNRIYI